MAKIIKFDPKLSTLEGTTTKRQEEVEATTKHINRQGSGPLSQDHLDALIRARKGRLAIEELMTETKRFQTYLLSDGRRLRINKVTGEIKIFAGVV